MPAGSKNAYKKVEVLIRELAQEKLTASEKTAIALSLRQRMNAYPTKLEKSINAPWYFPRSFFLVHRRLAVSFALMLIIVALFGGASAMAAQSSLPGEPLYPFKVNVNEELRSSLTFNAQAKMEWEVERLQRRLREAETLTLQKKLNQENSRLLKDYYQISSSRISSSMDNLRSSNQLATLSEFSANLEAVLHAHQAAITNVGTGEAEKASATEFLESVRTTTEQVSAIRVGASDQMLKSGTVDNFAVEAGRLKQEAWQQLMQAQNTLRLTNQSSIGSTALSQIETQLLNSQQSAKSGDAYLNKGSNAEAIFQYQESLHSTREGEVLLQTSIEMKAESLKYNSGEVQSATTEQKAEQDAQIQKIHTEYERTEVHSIEGAQESD